MSKMTFEDVHRGYVDFDISDETCFICDIDGTVVDLTHRRHWILDTPKNWKAFEAGIPDDEPIEWVINTVLYLQKLGLSMIMCSGRGEQTRKDTENQLEKHGLHPVKLYMRKEGDYRKDSTVKSELYDQIVEDGWDPKLVLDDRNQVVDMWRERGLECIQVAEGDF